MLDKLGGVITSTVCDVRFDPLTIQAKLWEIIQREYVPNKTFTRKEILEFVDEIGSTSKTPRQTVSRALQTLRDKKLIQFVTPGIYKRYPLVPCDITSLDDDTSEIRRNTRWFIPAGTRKKSHMCIKDACVSRGFAVFVVNGDGISLTLPCGTEVPVEKKDDLLNSKIKKMYTAYNLQEHPVAITGNICVGRGISISDPEFMFTHGVLSKFRTGAEASQLAGRLKGNMKDWPGFQPPTVFTTHLFDETVSKHEEQSRRLGKLAFEKEYSDSETATVTLDEFEDIGSSIDSHKRKLCREGIKEEDKGHKIFISQDKARIFIQKMWGKSIHNRKELAPMELRMEGNNPTVKYIITRWWGLSAKNLYRMVPTIDKTWCVYWKII